MPKLFHATSYISYIIYHISNTHIRCGGNRGNFAAMQLIYPSLHILQFKCGTRRASLRGTDKLIDIQNSTLVQPTRGPYTLIASSQISSPPRSSAGSPQEPIKSVVGLCQHIAHLITIPAHLIARNKYPYRKQNSQHRKDQLNIYRAGTAGVSYAQEHAHGSVSECIDKECVVRT